MKFEVQINDVDGTTVHATTKSTSEEASTFLNALDHEGATVTVSVIAENSEGGAALLAMFPSGE